MDVLKRVTAAPQIEEWRADVWPLQKPVSGIAHTDQGSADADHPSRPLPMQPPADLRHATQGLLDPDVPTTQDVPSPALSGLFSHYDPITRLFPLLPCFSPRGYLSAPFTLSFALRQQRASHPQPNILSLLSQQLARRLSLLCPALCTTLSPIPDSARDGFVARASGTGVARAAAFRHGATRETKG